MQNVPLFKQFYHEVFATRELFFSLNPRFVPRQAWLKLISNPGMLFHELKRIFILIKSTDKKVIFHADLKTFRAVNLDDRFKLGMLTYAIDFCHICAQIGSGITYIGALLYFLNELIYIRGYHIAHALAILFDLSIIVYIFVSSARNCLYNTYGIIIIAGVFRSMEKDFNKKLIQMVITEYRHRGGYRVPTVSGYFGIFRFPGN